MSFKAKVSSLALAASVVLLTSGCQEAQSPAAPEADNPGSGNPALSAGEKATLYPVLSEVASGTDKVTFHDAGDGKVFMTQVFDANRAPLVDESMDGLTYAEIHSRLAPGKPVPSHLASDTFRISIPDEKGLGPVEAAPLMGKTQIPLAKAASTDWVQSTNRKYSIFRVMLYQGSQITTKVKIGGNTVATGTVLYGQVWSASSTSGTDWLGFRKKQTHRMEISEGSGDGWHISAWYL